MRNSYVYVYDDTWLDSTALRNPINTLDHAMGEYFPEYYSLNYDLRLLASRLASTEEKAAPFYNDSAERHGTPKIADLDSVIVGKKPKSVFLNGFNQKQFLYIAPKLKDTVEIIYFFKCPKINDLSVLSQFANLRCVHIYWNHALESLWDMKDNHAFKVLSCTTITKLKDVETLKDSAVEYIHLDSSDNYGRSKPALFNPAVFEQMPQLRHLSLFYKT